MYVYGSKTIPTQVTLHVPVEQCVTNVCSQYDSV